MSDSEKGKKLYQSNKHFQHIANVMEHPLFKSFFREYFTDELSAKTMLILMKAYDQFPDEDPYIKLEKLKKFIDNHNNRKKLIDWIK